MNTWNDDYLQSDKRSISHNARHFLVVTQRERQWIDVLSALCKQGATLTVQQDGWYAYVYAWLEEPDLIIIDETLISMSGHVLCRLFGSMLKAQRIPIVMISSSTAVTFCTQECAVRAFAYGAIDYLRRSDPVDEILIRLFSHARMKSSESNSHLRDSTARSDRIFERAYARIRLGLGTNISVAKLAHDVGTNERTLEKIFKNLVGKSVHKYIIDEKIKVACLILSETCVPINKIATWVGYRSSCNFSIAFKNRCGQTPKQFRKKFLTGGRDMTEAETTHTYSLHTIKSDC